MNTKEIILVILIFAAGWFTHLAFSENSTPLEAAQAITGNLINGGTIERISPGNHIAEKDIQLSKDKIIISVDNPQWAIFTDTNSMDPVLDTGAHALQIVPTNTEEISVGDIISYENRNNITIIHRVIQINEDKEGWYAITKGDNNSGFDDEKIRFSQVRKLLIGVIY